eukprot:scaffold158467_cov28-Tisochrysis_lutea.AAC.5
MVRQREADCAHHPPASQGLNWFGQEGPERVPYGLTQRSLDDLMSFMEVNGFNALRLLFSLQNVEENLPTPAKAFNPDNSPELVDTDYMGMLKAIIRKAGEHNILVLLACHRIQNGYPNNEWPGTWNGRWTDKGWNAQRIFRVWSILLENFCGPSGPIAWNILGADILNEPFGMDWDEWSNAAKQLGNHVLHQCPRWLVFVEGVPPSPHLTALDSPVPSVAAPTTCCRAFRHWEHGAI